MHRASWRIINSQAAASRPPRTCERQIVAANRHDGEIVVLWRHRVPRLALPAGRSTEAAPLRDQPRLSRLRIEACRVEATKAGNRVKWQRQCDENRPF